MDRQFLLVFVGSVLLQASCVWETRAAPSTLVCEEPVYRVEEGESVTVCLRFRGPLALDDEDIKEGIFVEAGIYTVGNGVPNYNLNFSVTFDSQTRGLISLPCMEVRGVASGGGGRSVSVIISQSYPVEALTNCTVEIVESTEENTGEPGITEPLSTRGSSPQSQEAAGPIAGAAVGALIGLVGIIFAVVTLVVFCCYYQRTGSEHKKLGSSNGGPRPVMYKKPGRDSSGSELSVSSEATPPNRSESVVIPMDNPVYKETAVGHMTAGDDDHMTDDDETPGSPIYSNVSHEGPAPLPEEYEVPVSIMTDRSSSVDESPLAYEVPLRSKSDPLYHTLEPPEI